MIIYLCEKPSQASDIARILECTRYHGFFWEGDCIRVTWCFGHLLELAPPDYYNERYAQWCWDDLPIIPATWQLVPKNETLNHLNAIATLLASASSVVIATDADREGELIAREVLEYFGYSGPIQRLWLHALDDTSIRQALKELQPGHQTWPLYQSALARQRADWLIGVNFSRAMTLHLAPQNLYLFSVGRVQTPTLALVAAQDDRITRFIPQLSIEALCDLTSVEGVTLTQAKAKLTKRPELEPHSVQVTHKRINTNKTSAPLPFTLSELQQSAHLRWGFSALKTSELTQTLYERHKAISYPRTACPYLPQEQLPRALHLLKQIAQMSLSCSYLVGYTDSSLQHAAWNTSQVQSHHGIVPTLLPVNLSQMTGDEVLVYELICETFVRLFLPDYQSQTLCLKLANSEMEFEYNLEEPLVLGWKMGHIKSKFDFEFGIRTPWDLNIGEVLHVTSYTVREKQSRPPRPMTESQLLQAMKSSEPGLGTEATRAQIIETLLTRKYLKRLKEGFQVTAKGRTLLKNLPRELCQTHLTVEWEQQLDAIVRGEITVHEFIRQLTEQITNLLYSTQKDPDLEPVLPLGW